MSITEGQRVQVGQAKGDRERFRGRSGEVVRVQQRRVDYLEPFVHVRLDDARRSHVFWPHELVVADK